MIEQPLASLVTLIDCVLPSALLLLLAEDAPLLDEEEETELLDE